ncbi:abortive infection protein [Flavobacteriales bacterium 34_180_T64]|nr:abortive infection protein [Flavobacteriales bacterium 34_180_T64]
MESVTYKSAELFLIFILAPISFVLNFSIWVKVSLGLFGFLYVIFVLLRVEKKAFKIASNLNWKRFWIQTFYKLVVVVIVTSLYMWVVDKAHMFEVLRNKPLLWLGILFVYSLFSVYPQELIYRTFFFKRYENLFKSEYILIFVNAIVFSLAHLFFYKSLVLILTFLGGILFAWTYKKTSSTLLVSIEHAIYGCWLFTVGMGNMLGFPS